MQRYNKEVIMILIITTIIIVIVTLYVVKEAFIYIAGFVKLKFGLRQLVLMSSPSEGPFMQVTFRW